MVTHNDEKQSYNYEKASHHYEIICDNYEEKKNMTTAWVLIFPSTGLSPTPLINVTTQ